MRCRKLPRPAQASLPSIRIAAVAHVTLVRHLPRLRPVPPVLDAIQALPLAVLIATPLIVLGAYTIFGISGFGSALISIPLLAHFLPLKIVVPLMLLLDFSAALTTGLRFRIDVDRAEVKSVLPAIIVGAVVGVLLLAKVRGETLMVALGVFVGGYGLYRLLARGAPRAMSARLAHPIGFFGGVLGALFGVGGPLYVMYFSSRIHDPARLRATLSVVFSMSTGFRIALFILSGLLLDWRILLSALALFPLMVLGTRIGQRIHLKLDRQKLSRFVAALLIFSGVSLAVRGLTMH